MSTPAKLGDKELIDAACAELGLSIDQLGEKLKFKSIRRYRNGEYSLTETKRQHLQDLLAIRKVGLVEIQDLHPLRHAPSNMPPHSEPDSVYSRQREDPAPMAPGAAGGFDFAQCVKFLSDLHERNPQAFRAAAAMIKGLHDSLKK